MLATIPPFIFYVGLVLIFVLTCYGLNALMTWLCSRREEPRSEYTPHPQYWHPHLPAASTVIQNPKPKISPPMPSPRSKGTESNGR